jgi:hypothetical protein
MAAPTAVAIIAPPGCDEVAEKIADFLRDNRFDVGAEAVPAEICIVLVAPALTGVWGEHPGVAGKHLVPVLVEPTDDRLVPAEVRAINWTRWQPGNVPAALAAVLVAVSTRHSMWRTLRQLRLQVYDWYVAHRDPALLIQDSPRAQECQEVLNDLRDSLGGREEVHLLDEYVAKSTAACRAKARTQRRRCMAGALVLVLAELAAAVLIPIVQSAGRSNRNAIVTSGEESLAREFPEWSALLAADLLIHGTPEQQALARLTLRRSLSADWSLGTGYSVEAQLPLTSVRSAVVLSYESKAERSSLIGMDVKTGQFAWRVQLPGEYLYMGLTEGDGEVVVGGASGFGVFDLRDHSFRQVRANPIPKRMVLLDSRHAVVVDEDIRVHVVDLNSGGGSRKTGRHQTLVDIQATDDGGVRALVRREAGDFALIDAATGAVLAAGSLPEPVVEAGGVALDEVAAYLASGDHQIWYLTPAGPPTPTGIALIDRTSLIRGARGGKVIFGGDAQRPRVVRLPSGADLGVVCRETPLVWEIKLARDGQSVECTGPHQNSLWRLPSGTSAEVPASLDDNALLDMFRAKSYGCWLDTQLLNIDGASRSALGVRVCGAVPEPERK